MTPKEELVREWLTLADEEEAIEIDRSIYEFVLNALPDFRHR